MFGIQYHREEREVQLSGYSGRGTTAAAELITFDRQQRRRRAWLGLSTWWAVALVTALIPVAHLLLVPGFISFGIYSFVRRNRIAIVAVAVRGTCPDCNEEQAFDPPDRWDERPSLTCGNCHRSIRLSASQ